MILFRLVCDCGHEFETWFQSGRAFDVLAAAGELSCPACGGARVNKALMAPRIAKGAGTEEAHRSSPGSAVAAADTPVAEPQADLVAAVRRLRQEVKDKADYVGPRFAEEARKIDAGEAPERGIYGEASVSEAKALIDDGIAILPLPRLPEENH